MDDNKTPEHGNKPANPEHQQKPEQPVQKPSSGPVGTEGVGGSTPAPTPAPTPDAGSKMPETAGTPSPQPEAKKGKAAKIILGILGGCVVLAIIFGLLAFFGLRKAANEFGDIIEEANELPTYDGTEYTGGELTPEQQAEIDEFEAELDALFEELDLEAETTVDPDDKRPN